MSEGNGKIPQEQGTVRESVGYKRPPVHSRFKKGQSGNPGGKPKGPTLLAEIHAELDARGGKRRKASARAYVDQMERGSLPHAKEVIEREEGDAPTDGKLVIELVLREAPPLADDPSPN